MPKPCILISSCARDAANGTNQAVRDTWGADSAIPYFFLLGKGNTATNRDEIILDVPDDYPALPYKTREGHRWALGIGFDYFFQCFVDTFIDTERLLASGFEKHDYTGNESEPYPGFTFAHGGPGYWLSRKATKLLLDKPIIPSEHDSDQYEDQWAGRTLGKLGIHCACDKRYSMGWSYGKGEPGFALPENEVISVHLSSLPGKYESEWMHQVYAKRYGIPFEPTKMRMQGCSCRKCVARALAEGKPTYGSS